MLLQNPAVIRTRHADGATTSSIHKRFAPSETVENKIPLIPSHEFVGAEFPLQRAFRQLATDKLFSVNQSVVQHAN